MAITFSSLNGVETADLHDSAKLSGILALQLHAGPPMAFATSASRSWCPH
jgi:hypothetical protein